MNLFEDKIFNNDPIYMKSLVGKSVKVSTIENESHTGIVYVIDPIYKTIVLHTKVSENKHDTVFILHHAISSLDVLSEEVDKSYLVNKDIVQETSDLLVLEKTRLKKWLQHMYINVNEVGDYLKIDDHLIIMPPYGMDNCICNNTIVLEKIRNIIGLMPKEFS